MGGVRVTVEDMATGTVRTLLVDDGWLLITAGRVYVDGERYYSNGTAVITIKRTAPDEAAKQLGARLGVGL